MKYTYNFQAKYTYLGATQLACLPRHVRRHVDQAAEQCTQWHARQPAFAVLRTERQYDRSAPLALTPDMGLVEPQDPDGAKLLVLRCAACGIELVLEEERHREHHVVQVAVGFFSVITCVEVG